MHGLDLNLLKVFEAVLVERSVTRAASRLYLTQSATSSALARLRVAFKDPLFVRSADGLVPTPAALALAEPIGAALQQIAQAIEASQAFDPMETRERCCIRAADHILLRLLPLLVPILAEEAPNLLLDILPLSAGGLPEQLRVGDLDILIAYAFNSGTENLRTTHFLSERSVAIFRRDHPLFTGELTLEQYVAADHIVLRPRGAWLNSPIDRAMAVQGHARKVKIYVAGYLLVPQLLEASDYIASMPEVLAERFSKQFNLRYEPLPFDAPEVEVCMAWHERAHSNKAHAWLRQKIAGLRSRL